MAMPQLGIPLHDESKQQDVDALMEEAEDAHRPVSDVGTSTPLL